MVGLVSIAVMFAVGVFVFVCAAVIGFGWGEKVGLAVLFVSGLAAASTCLHLASYSPPGNLENAADWDRELESLEHRLAILDIVLCFFVLVQPSFSPVRAGGCGHIVARSFRFSIGTPVVKPTSPVFAIRLPVDRGRHLSTLHQF